MAAQDALANAVVTSMPELKVAANGFVTVMESPRYEVKTFSTPLGKSLIQVARSSIADYSTGQRVFPVVLFLSRCLFFPIICHTLLLNDGPDLPCPKILL